MRKLWRSRKALSPVIAAIILIAVTVAVSIAVAAWMGALSFTFMAGGEELQVGSPWGWTDTGSVVYVNVTNNGGSTIEISHARINETLCTVDMQGETGTVDDKLAPNEMAGLEITYTTGFKADYSYTITVVTVANNEFQTTGEVPTP